VQDKNETTVKHLFQTFYGKAPSAADLKKYTAELKSGKTQAQVIQEIVTSGSYKDQFGKGKNFDSQKYAETTTTDLYKAILGHAPSNHDFRDVADKIDTALNAGDSLAQAVGPSITALEKQVKKK